MLRFLRHIYEYYFRRDRYAWLKFDRERPPTEGDTITFNGKLRAEFKSIEPTN